MTEVRRGRARQGDLVQGARAIAGRVTGALGRLGQTIERNASENRQRSERSRQEAQRRENTTGSTAFRRYMSGIMRGGGDHQLERRVEATSQTIDRIRRTHGMPEARPLDSEVDQYIREARTSDARARNDAVSEDRPRGNGAELTRGDGTGRRGVLQRPFTINVDGQDVEISDNQRVVLAEYTREHPRAFSNFADWFNAISTLDGLRTENLTAEQIAAARRVWTQPASTSPPTDAQGRELELQTVMDRNGNVTGYRETGGLRQNTSTWQQGSGPIEGGLEPPSYTPEEMTTAQSELMRITRRNMAERTRGQSRAIAARGSGNQPQSAINLPAEIVGAVVARSRIESEMEAARREVAPRNPTQAEYLPATKAGSDSKSSGKPSDGKQQQRGTLMTSREVAAQQADRQRADRPAADGISMEDPGVDPFTRERILPVAPPAEGESSGSATLRRLRGAGRVSVGGVQLEPTENGVRGRVRW